VAYRKSPTPRGNDTTEAVEPEPSVTHTEAVESVHARRTVSPAPITASRRIVPPLVRPATAVNSMRPRDFNEYVPIGAYSADTSVTALPQASVKNPGKDCVACDSEYRHTPTSGHIVPIA